MSTSTITIIGNVADKPQLKTTNQGKNVTKFVIGSSRSWRTDEGWQRGETTYLDVDCWNRLARNVVNTLEVGTPVMVQGRLETNSWKDQEGNKQYRTRLKAESVAVDLRFATAKVSRNPRNGDSETGGNGGHGSGEFAEGPGHDEAAGDRVPVGAGVGASESNAAMGETTAGADGGHGQAGQADGDNGGGYADAGDAPF